MDEKAIETKRPGAPRKYPRAVYKLAYEMYTIANMSAAATAEAINAKDISPTRVDGTLVKGLAAMGRRDAEAANG